METIKWRTVRGTQPERPEAIDKTSSAAVVYMRKNIHRVEVTEDESAEPILFWEYDEAILTPEQYEEYDREINGTALTITIQHINDLAASQELSDITAEANHEEQMQLLNDIQADILLGGE